ncbi:hypothetical protein [Rathayibacter toxicus]|uniref:YtxH domain-containing protein n=1 Tax=Rathayibacter toxicus TaxID=145458 RepID=A0A0U1PSA4_9MICO|nr:hypothetical protein [Rathayibacter toxicus]ALS57610.1 hypothetical protein APU90_07400 [Rathayibacter toxicus]KKM44964.1 hypothetical protein VT73_07565 [Rathayibacter toxicus]PPG20719.1 hypothetical protein C5D15_09525 [Rathayibacter toxicus]PPG45823.1 hypothetical protein C5D16_09490 [Rathayibacter toxicus]PPH21766.1 hypothetical protein C5D17_09495 [Rathayibacter toxicus]
MNPRLVLLMLIAGVAYVLGARAGRTRYEELRHLALGAWHDPAMKKTRKKLKKASQREAKQCAAIANKARTKLKNSLH